MAGITSFVVGTKAEEWRKFWERKASEPDADTAAGVAYTFSTQHHYLVEAFRALCGEMPAAPLIMDVGCGNGMFWKALFKDRPVVGVDYSIGMCRLAQSRGMNMYQADALALPFADGQFDLIYSAEILQYIDDLSALMAELARVCQPGGRIIVSTHNRLSLLSRAVRAARKIFPRRHVPIPTAAVMRSAEEMAEAGASASLQLRTICWTHFPFPWQYRSTQTGYLLAPLASNIVTEFVKPA